VLGRRYEGQNCSIARTLEVVGERWTLLVLRECFLGTTRFASFQRRLGIARNVLQTRLELLVDEGILVRRRYQERPPRDEYRLTDQGRDLLPVLISLLQWGDRHRSPQGPPAAIAHASCGGPVNAALRCERCGALVEGRTIAVQWREPPAALTPAAPSA
jgi:DNA-binding HxlR family transcriptional regulator